VVPTVLSKLMLDQIRAERVMKLSENDKFDIENTAK
jgi:hypothetical protein